MLSITFYNPTKSSFDSFLKNGKMISTEYKNSNLPRVTHFVWVEFIFPVSTIKIKLKHQVTWQMRKCTCMILALPATFNQLYHSYLLLNLFKNLGDHWISKDLCSQEKSRSKLNVHFFSNANEGDGHLISSRKRYEIWNMIRGSQSGVLERYETRFGDSFYRFPSL
eukprot:sb/3472459/